MTRHVVFSHGQESGPWGRKISALAEIARSEGYEAHSVDYRGIDMPRARVARQRTRLGEGLSAAGQNQDAVEAYMTCAYAAPDSIWARMALDGAGQSVEVVPYEHSVRFAHAYRAALHLLDSDHRLHNQVRVIQHLFEYFLIALDLPAIAFE